MDQQQATPSAQPVSFTLPNSNGERYYLSADVSAFLRLPWGLFKKYPRMWKRPLTPSEKTYLSQIGICKHNTRSHVVKCVEADKLIRRRYPNGVPLPTSSGSSTSVNGDRSLNGDTKFSELSEFSENMQGTSNSSMNTSSALGTTPTKLKQLKMTINVKDLEIPRKPLDTLDTKPTSFLLKNAEGSDTELYYTSSDILMYTRRCFNIQHYPLMWRKCVPTGDLISKSVRVRAYEPLTKIYRAREVDEIISGLDLKYCIPLDANGRLRSFTLGDQDERYYIAHFVTLATNTKLLQCYNLWKRLLNKADKAHLRRQGVYGTSLKWMALKVREVDDLFEGKLGNYYPTRRNSTLSIIKPVVSRSLLKRAKNTKLASRKKALAANSNHDLIACEWQVHDDNTVGTSATAVNSCGNGMVNGVSRVPLDVGALKEKIMRDIVKMCVYLRMPLTVVENEMFRSICQTLIEIGRDSASQPRLHPDAVIPTYAESRAFVDRVMASTRDAMIEEAHGVALNGGIAVSIYCNAFTKSHNLVFVTLHFISSDWTLKAVTVPPVGLMQWDDNNSGVNIKHQVLNAIGIAPAVPPPVPAPPMVLPPNGLKMELEDEPVLKRLKIGGDPFASVRIEGVFTSVDPPAAATNSIAEDNLHFVMNNLFGDYFRDLSRATKFLSATSVTRCCARYIAALRWKISSKQEKMNFNPEQIRYFDERLIDPVLKTLNVLKKDDIPTVNRILPTVREWIQHYEHIVKTEENELVRAFAEELLEECQTTYEKHLYKDLFFFAIILDPSQKNKIRDYLPDKQKKNELTERFKVAVVHYRTLYGGHNQDSSSERVVDSFFDDEELRQEDDVDKEILSYLCTPSVEFTTNPNPSAANSQMKSDADGYVDVLDFWRRNERKFPNCARLARRVLAIPATAERDALSQVFTAGGSTASNIDAEVLRQEAQAKSIVDLGVLLAMGR